MLAVMGFAVEARQMEIGEAVADEWSFIGRAFAAAAKKRAQADRTQAQELAPRDGGVRTRVF